MSSCVGDRCLRTSFNGLVSNSWPWVDGDDNLEGCSDAVACRSGGRGDGVGNSLNRIGDVGECLGNRILTSCLGTLTGDVGISRYGPGVGSICGNYGGPSVGRRYAEGIAGANCRGTILDDRFRINGNDEGIRRAWTTYSICGVDRCYNDFPLDG